MSDSLDILHDFSDLGKEVKFKINDKEYIIGLITPKKSKELFAISKRVSADSKRYQDLIKKQEEDPSFEIPADVDIDIFDFQMQFITTSVTNVTKEEIEDTWSTRQIARVVELINNVISGEQEKKS